MKRVLGLALASAALLLLTGAFASQARAATTVPVSLTFNEPIVPAVHSGCAVLPDGFCGSGQVNPFGQATETIQFGACGTTCDLRTVYLASGSIVIHETFSDPACPGVCQPNPAEPAFGTLTDVIAGGTGKFTGASGNLSGSVTAAGGVGNPGGVSVIKLSGTITLTP